MDNKVGDNTPTDKVVASLLTQLVHVVTELKKFGIILDPEDRKRLLHARRSFEPQMTRVHDLAIEYGVSLPGIPLEGMKNDLALYETLHPFYDAFRSGLTLVEDTAGQAESEAWEAFLAYYATLSGMASRLPELATALEPVTAFMSNSKRRKGTAADTPAAPKPA